MLESLQASNESISTGGGFNYIVKDIKKAANNSFYSFEK